MCEFWLLASRFTIRDRFGVVALARAVATVLQRFELVELGGRRLVDFEVRRGAPRAHLLEDESVSGFRRLLVDTQPAVTVVDVPVVALGGIDFPLLHVGEASVLELLGGRRTIVGRESVDDDARDRHECCDAGGADNPLAPMIGCDPTLLRGSDDGDGLRLTGIHGYLLSVEKLGTQCESSDSLVVKLT